MCDIHALKELMHGKGGDKLVIDDLKLTRQASTKPVDRTSNKTEMLRPKKSDVTKS